LLNKDLTGLLNASSIIIDSSGKAGKMTFLFYMVNFLYKSKAIIFTPQESYLFNRRIKALSSQYPQFKDLENIITPYFLADDWNGLKQKYGYEFFIQELTRIILSAEEKIIVMHRIAEFFEFQDRYEIENVYKALIKLAAEHDKKIIFLSNNQNENYEYLRRIADEFTDVSISLHSNERNERLLNIKDVLHNKEYPVFHFKIHNNNFILDAYEKNQSFENTKMKNVLIAELDIAHDNVKDICSYIFEKPNFSVKYADSLQSILQEVFISPDIVVVMMKRSQKNFDTVSAIKKHLPDTSIIGIIDQNFVRTEDVQEAYANGCSELFANNFSLEELILALQKASKTLFYSESLKTLPVFENVMNNLEDFKTLAKACIAKSIFFTAFTMECKQKFESVKVPSRNNDYVFQTDHKVYYLAISTMPKDIKHITEHYKERYDNIELTCIWEPINHESLDECIS
jgi:CheY-like chemotaxis protein